MFPRSLPLALVLLACGGSSDTPTYFGDAKPIVDSKCATCHRAGDIAPFPLTTYEEVIAFQAPVLASIVNGTMPPWQPSHDCGSYVEDIDLTESERDTLIAWLDADAPEGTPTEVVDVEEQTRTLEADIVLQLPEAYAPVREPDDYRCQLIDWPATETRYVTGLQVVPDQRSIVHHSIVFVVGPELADEYRAFDAAEEGPGYTCYGGPSPNTGESGMGDVDLPALLAALAAQGLTLADVQAGRISIEQLEALQQAVGGTGISSFGTIGSWVPGAPPALYPEGTGILVEPGSLLVAQFHYNTLTAAPVADRSTIEIATTDRVEREGTNLPALDLGWVTDGRMGEAMTIPAGVEHVEHATEVAFDSLFMGSARQTLNLPSDAPLQLHRAAHHMHELGTSQRTELRHADGSTSCVLDIEDWDFAWQGSYTLTQPLTVQQGDTLWMGCTWDNSAANQPVVDGEVREPADVAWGEGTADEMCLGSYYVTSVP